MEHPPSNKLNDAEPLPPYLARHAKLGFNTADVTALIDSIDSSQHPSQTSANHVHLPAELLLEIIAHVPVDYILDWRLVCRGFRDAIDGRVLYHQLRRTELIGSLGARHARQMHFLTDDQYEELHMMRTQFSHFEDPADETQQTTTATAAEGHASKLVWSARVAVFQVEPEWFRCWRQARMSSNGLATRKGAALWWSALQRLELLIADEGFGSLLWCIRLDHAVLDLAFPLQTGRDHFLFDFNLSTGKIRVAWREMLVGFLKTERSLRRLMAKKQDSSFTYSHMEDCLRAIRRQRLQSSLNVENNADRHIKWSLRLLPPLFGKPRDNHTAPLEDVENEATSLLLFLRREAALTPKQIAYLHQLATDYETMKNEVENLDKAFSEFKSHLTMSGLQWSVSLPMLSPEQYSRNPIAWPDKFIAGMEDVVGKWKAQQKVLSQMKMLLDSSNLAMSLPEDSFDDNMSDDL
ncbi:hypothetical protein J1614_003172 [Plenodomus biglobosus]|nr:hypothetical protein J1614_003172 [Plenodomus biglobosus]